MALDHLVEKFGLGARDVLDGLAGHGLGQKADEIAGMAGPHRHADLAVGLEAADARAVPGARIDDDEGPRGLADLHIGRRHDAHEPVIDRAVELAPVHHKLAFEFENVRRGLGRMLAIGIAPLPHHIEEQHRALRSIGRVFARGGEHSRHREIAAFRTGRS